MDDTQFRQFARAGALTMCLRALAEFPDILTDLNATAKGTDRQLARKAAPVKRAWSTAARKAQSERLKKRWAAKKRGK